MIIQTRLMEEDEEDYALPNDDDCSRISLPITKGYTHD